jgi:hypothetical protein
MGLPWYCTREDVMSALDIKFTARMTAQVDRAIDAASRSVEGLTHRRFYPETATRYFDYPGDQVGPPWVLYLNANELVTLTTLASGGVTIPAASVNLEPNWGPPYSRVEIKLSTSAAFGGGATFQRDIALTGVFGYRADTTPAGALAEDLDLTETGVDVTDSSLIGVGDLVYAGTELLQVTGKSMLTTGQTLQTPLTASKANDTVAVTTGTAYAAGEVLLLDSERMLVQDITGNNLTVERAWDGTTLATHTGSTIYAARTLTVVRGALGTTAATHSTSLALTRHVNPGPVRSLTIAEAINTIEQEQAGYVRTVGSGDNARNASGAGLADLRDQVYTTYGRKARVRAV